MTGNRAARYSKINLDMYCLASIFKTIIDTTFLYSFRYIIKIGVKITFSQHNNLLK